MTERMRKEMLAAIDQLYGSMGPSRVLEISWEMFEDIMQPILAFIGWPDWEEKK